MHKTGNYLLKLVFLYIYIVTLNLYILLGKVSHYIYQVLKKKKKLFYWSQGNNLKYGKRQIHQDSWSMLVVIQMITQFIIQICCLSRVQGTLFIVMPE